MFKLGAQLATGCIQQFLEKRSHVACGRRGDSAHFQRGRSVSVAAVVVVAAILLLLQLSLELVTTISAAYMLN